MAGEGPVDRLVPGLAIDADAPPSAGEVADALVGVDLVVVENLLTIPLNLPASRVVAGVLRGRPALLHHHDPPWQRDRFAHVTELPAQHPSWHHVAISRLAAAELAERGIQSDVVYNAVELDDAPGQGDGARCGAAWASTRVDRCSCTRPRHRAQGRASRAGPRDRRRRHLLAARAGRGGYGPTLGTVLAGATVPVLRMPFAHDERAARMPRPTPCSTPRRGRASASPLEAAVHRRPVVVGDYPAAAELRALGFRWLRDDAEPLRRALAEPAALCDDLAHNGALVRRHFSMAGLEAALADILARAGWRP